MEREERLKKTIKAIYAEIVHEAIDKTFSFPNGGLVDRRLSQFVEQFAQLCGGELNGTRLVDYCIFQIHKNRQSPYQHKLAPNAFGTTALQKYRQMSSKQKRYAEDRWLEDNSLTRSQLYALVADKKAHPQAKYVYMAAEESTKRRFHNTNMGLAICAASTLMWSPFSAACQECGNAGRCKEETERRYPELYRIRLEEYDKRR